MHQLFKLQNRLRKHAVWRHPEDQAWTGNHAEHPRFLAVVEDVTEFHAYWEESQRLARKLKRKGLSTRWVPVFLDEVWVYATLQQSQALKTQLFTGGPHTLSIPGQFPEGEMLDALHRDIERIREHFPELNAEIQSNAPGSGGHSFTFTTPTPLTLRLSEGRRFRMYARTVNRGTHKDLKVGAIVIRGLQQDVQVSRPRIPRADQKQLLFTVGPLSFYR
ncbi:hypothetical protein GCM10008938_32990 [Deinococcus roseus]|uniref:Uncharacterized protein n=2 Tax=Deinococcus roseus TaxID=392414 RepID=A0ABQ2D389_9DEIO|nr:hypothetical protein GCM10008938_32990 [Deinococcus roseus]